MPKKEQSVAQKQRASKANDVSAALGDESYTHVLSRMEGTEDEANVETEHSATVVTAPQSLHAQNWICGRPPAPQIPLLISTT
jgi:hypothetical protein